MTQNNELLIEISSFDEVGFFHLGDFQVQDQ